MRVELDPRVGDLAMLVARLIQQVRHQDPQNDVAEKAMDYLRRKDLRGSVLREIEQRIPGVELEIQSAKHELVRIAAELLIQREVPDPEYLEFKSIGRGKAAIIRAASHERGVRLKQAIDILRKHGVL